MAVVPAGQARGGMGEGLGGMQGGGVRAVGQPPEGKAHGANSCRCEMLTPLNAQS